MSKNAKTMAKDYHVCYTTMCRWIKKGFYGDILKDTSGAYMLPDDLPLPYKANGKTERDTSLLKCFLDASDLGRVVHKNMFPRISEARYNRLLLFAIEEHLVEAYSPYPGIVQLMSTPEGRALLMEEPKTQKKIFEIIQRGTPLLVALSEFCIMCGPQLLHMLSPVA